MPKILLVLVALGCLGTRLSACVQEDPQTISDREDRSVQNLPDELRLLVQDDDADDNRTVGDIAGDREVQIRQLRTVDQSRFRSLDDFEIRVPDIVNGEPTFAHGSAGALLENVNGRLETLCSGTMIGCDTFLTANHCFQSSRNEEKYSVFLPSEGIIPVEYIYPEHEDYEPTSPVADLALVELTESISVVAPTTLNSDDTVDDQTEGTIVGYGLTGASADDDGIKRAGDITTSPCNFSDAPEGLICWEFKEELPSTCYLDSGGPMFVDGPGGTLAVAGVTASGDGDCAPDSTSIDVDVRHYTDWILNQAGAGNIGQNSCGIVASQPSGGTMLMEKSDNLGQSDSHQYSQILETDIAQVRVGLNGTDKFNNNFDLAVSVSSTNGGDIDGCSDNRLGNYAYCDLNLTESQTVLAVTVSQNGMGPGGEYQLLVTALSAADILQ